MDIIKHLFKWFTVKGNNGEKMNLGYVLEGEPKTFDDIEKLLNAFKLDKYYQRLKPLMKNKIEVTLTPSTEEDFIAVASKVGGQPDLLQAQDWPKTEVGKSMSFIAQLNCAEVSQYDKSGLLPKEGLISFFYCADQEAWGFDPKDKTRFKVLYTNDISRLNRITFPNDLEQHSVFIPNKIQFESCLSMPGWEDDCIAGMIEEKDSDNFFEANAGSENQLFGYANCIQGPMELECQLVTNGIYCGDSKGYENERRKELEAGKEDWVLLFQIDSEEEKTGMMWGDAGRIYFWIKKQDLKNKTFENSWFVYQCY